MKLLMILLFAVLSAPPLTLAQQAWSAPLDAQIVFYQTTDFGIVVAGTERSIYGIDGQAGTQLWRRPAGGLDETSAVPVPGTDLLLVSRRAGRSSRLEALNVMTGDTAWQSEKIKGAVLQLAADPQSDLLALAVVRDARGPARGTIERKPVIYVLELSSGRELWRRELDGEIEMMPARFGGGDGGEISFTLDNYRAPLLLDERLFVFYDGVASYDARTGKEKQRDKFRVNAGGLALTEGDPVFDDEKVYVSGRGKIRAVSRQSGEPVWESSDVGTASELAVVGERLFVRTGGIFTRVKDGKTEAKGPFGLAAIDVRTGKVLWRFKGADKGLTNFVFADAATIKIADRNDLISVDAASGKAIEKFEHGVGDAQFLLVNENGAAIVGGPDEIAAYGAAKRELWRDRHKPPARGILRFVSGIALRAAALYFRYGGAATSAIGLARGGLGLASAIDSFRWSGLNSRFDSINLATLASGTVKNYATAKLYSFGGLPYVAGARGLAAEIQLRPAAPALPGGERVSRSVLDRVDPASVAERLSNYLLKRRRLAALRGRFMYYFTDLKAPFDRKGLVGVNIQSGQDERFILAAEPDAKFITDEAAGLLYSADGSRLDAFEFLNR